MKNVWPDCRITWLVGEVSAPVLTGNPHIDEIIIWSREQFETHLKNFKFRQALKNWQYLQQVLPPKTFDVVLDIHGLFLTGMIAIQAKGIRRIGLSNTKEFNNLFMNETADPIGKHITDKYLSALIPLGIPVVDHRMTLVVPEEARRFAKKLIRENGLSNKRFIIMIPGTTWPSKNWPVNFFAKTARLLYDNFAIVLCGRKNESVVASNIQKEAGVPIINVVGQTDLLEMAGLIEQAAVLVAGDTGPLHMAAALDIPTVAIFGPTNPEIYAPLGEKHAVVLRRLSCSFCHKMTCPKGTRDCMNSVTPEDVLQQVHSLVEEHSHFYITAQNQTRLTNCKQPK